MAENPISNKSLSIRVCTNGLSFCTYTPGSPTPFVYKECDVNHTISLAANLKEAFRTEPLLQQQYKRVNVLVTTSRFTTMPVAMFKAEDVKEYFDFAFPKEAPCRVSYNVLRRSGIAIVFGLDKNVYQLIHDDFPMARFYASSSTLIEYFSERSLFGANKKMFVYLHEKELTLYVFEQGRMLFVNTYRASNVNDFQFYTLNVWKQLDMDQVEDALFIVGDNDHAQEYSEKIKYFLQNVDVMNRSDDFKNSITAGNKLIPYDLQTLLVCGF